MKNKYAQAWGGGADLSEESNIRSLNGSVVCTQH